jgi:hypothetical protein
MVSSTSVLTRSLASTPHARSSLLRSRGPRTPGAPRAVPLLCEARPGVVRLVGSILREFERARGDRKPAGTLRRTTRKRDRRRGTRKRCRGTRRPEHALVLALDVDVISRCGGGWGQVRYTP